MAPNELSEIECAARFLYLNKTAWNGLYRVNRTGQFNVPYGLPKSNNIVSRDHLSRGASLLMRAELLAADFEESLAGAARNDLVFVDPPYAVQDTRKSFTHYNSRLFSWKDQVRLAHVCHELASKGVHVVVTNVDNEAVRGLYDGFQVGSISRYSTLAGRSEHRRPTTELIFSTMRTK